MRKVAALMLLGWIWTGCATTEPDTIGEQSWTEPEGIVHLEAALNGKVRAGNVRVERDENGILVALCDLKNLQTEPIWLECRVVFRDKNGETIETGPWRPLRLTRTGQDTYPAGTTLKHPDRFMIGIRRRIPRDW